MSRGNSEVDGRRGRGEGRDFCWLLVRTPPSPFGVLPPAGEEGKSAERRIIRQRSFRIVPSTGTDEKVAWGLLQTGGLGEMERSTGAFYDFVVPGSSLTEVAFQSETPTSLRQ